MADWVRTCADSFRCCAVGICLCVVSPVSAEDKLTVHDLGCHQSNREHRPWREQDGRNGMSTGHKRETPHRIKGFRTARRLPSQWLRLLIVVFAAVQMAEGSCLYPPDMNGHSNVPANVTSIGDHAFAFCTPLVSISMSSVTYIGEGAFYECTRLALTSLPSGVTSIGNEAFYRCSALALASLPSGVTFIGNNAFYQCTSLALASLPAGTTSITVEAVMPIFNATLSPSPSPRARQSAPEDSIGGAKSSDLTGATGSETTSAAIINSVFAVTFIFMSWFALLCILRASFNSSEGL